MELDLDFGTDPACLFFQDWISITYLVFYLTVFAVIFAFMKEVRSAQSGGYVHGPATLGSTTVVTNQQVPLQPAPQGYAQQPQGYAQPPQGYAQPPPNYSQQGYPSPPAAYAQQPPSALGY